MIVFKNKGEIDIRCVTTFGVSSKETDNPIGYFGTGFKYAIAICLRYGMAVKLYSGKDLYEFGVSKERIRVDDFNVITMNGKPLGFTTDLGRDWEPWQAFRELWCNTIDESGTIKQKQNLPNGKSGYTTLVVVGKQFEDIYRDRDSYFIINRKPVYQTKYCDIYNRKGNSGAFYLRGVRVGKPYQSALYDYNFHADIDLSEDRTIKYSFQADNLVQRSIQSSEDKKYIENMLTASPASFEGKINYCDSYRNGDQYGEAFLDVLGELRHQHVDTNINASALSVHMKLRERSVLPTVSCEMDNVEKQQLSKAVRFCKDALRLNVDEYPLIVADNLGGSLGRADIEQKIMYISRECFANGVKNVVFAILEEYTHVHHGVHDETLEQKWVYLKMIANLGERLIGEPL